MFDTAKYKNNPVLSFFKQQIQVEHNKYELEKAKMLPEFSLGYFNQSLIGTQTVDGTAQFFGANKRFTGFNIGIAVPLWFKPLTAQKQAASEAGPGTTPAPNASCSFPILAKAGS